MGTTVTNQNLIHEKIKRMLKVQITCYHFVHSLVLSRLLFESIKDLNVQKNNIYYFFVCET
jgi:hypothetical protein